MSRRALPTWLERVLGTEPLPAPADVFFLEAETLHHGSCRHSPQGQILERVHTAALSAGVLGDGPLGGPLRDAAALEEAIRELLEAAPAPIDRATLVLPDAWLRLAFAELPELPRSAATRDAMIRFKLKRLVPFRVEDLRLSIARVRPFPDQEDPVRVLLALAMDAFLTAIEGSFEAAGIRIGRISNETLSLAASIRGAAGSGSLPLLAVVRPDAYTLAVMRGDEPLLYRFKTLTASMPQEARDAAVERELHLTRSFLEERLPGEPIGPVFVVASGSARAAWLEALESAFGARAEALSWDHLGLARIPEPSAWRIGAPILGAHSMAIG